MTGTSIDATIHRIVSSQGEKMPTFVDKTIHLEYALKGVRISQFRKEDGRVANFVYFKGNLVYEGRSSNNGANFNREVFARGNWEEILNDINRQGLLFYPEK